MRPEILNNNVKAVFFDLDNTLIDRDLAFRTGLPEWLTKNVPDIPVSQYPDHIIRITKQDQHGHSNRYEFCEWIKRTYNLSGLSTDRIQAELSSVITHNTFRNNEVNNFLQLLKKQFLIGIISNGSGMTQRAKIQNAGLATIFDEGNIYIEGEKGPGKPHPFMFQAASTDHKIPASHFLFVGDHPINDMTGAREAGMKTCWIRNGQSTSSLSFQPDFTVRTIHHWSKEETYVLS